MTHIIDRVRQIARADVIGALRECGVRLCTIKSSEVRKQVDKLMADPQYVARVSQWVSEIASKGEQ